MVLTIASHSIRSFRMNRGSDSRATLRSDERTVWAANDNDVYSFDSSIDAPLEVGSETFTQACL
jgi:hypothetical protein